MKITIDITKKELEHICPDHTFYDGCSEVEFIMRKVQKECLKYYHPKKVNTSNFIVKTNKDGSKSISFYGTQNGKRKKVIINARR